ncbi:tetratricopeptide repeat protein [Candidatus Sumerlaeota bacterium]|nr:tetratricopeptide repeat protein [Candidatus Sumerlaeota bacterium]
MAGIGKKNKTPHIKSQQQAEQNKLLWAGILLILVVTFLSYLPATKAGYIWDDDDHFTENDLMNDWEGFKKIWSSSSAIYYPLVLSSFWIMRRLWGLAPLPYHVVNILIHATNALVLWAILRRLKIKGGFFAAFLFALHPAHVESVAWVTELKNTQSGLFYLLSFLFFHKYYAAAKERTLIPRKEKKNAAFYFLSLFLFVLALLSKPSTVMLPAVLVLFILWREERIKIRNFIITAPFFVFSLLSSVWTIWEQKYHSGAKGAEWSLTLLERLLVAGRIVWFYLIKLIFPYPLMFIYPRWEVNASSFLWYLPLAGIAIAFALFFLKWKSWGRNLAFGFGYFLILLFPVLGFFNIYFMRFSYVGDHFQYLATICPLALFSAGLFTFTERFGVNAGVLRKIIYSFILIVFAILVWRQSLIYKNEETLWKDAIRRNPNAWIAWHNMGFLMMNEKRNEEAMQYYSKALQLKPDYWEAHFNMGLILAKEGYPDQAVECFQKALELNPLEIKIHGDLALALSKIGRFDEAMKEIDYFLKNQPDDSSALYNKATILSDMGRFAESIAWYERAVDSEPDFYQAYCDMGTAFFRIGEKDKAIAQFQKALSINPDDEVARANLEIIRRGATDVAPE